MDHFSHKHPLILNEDYIAREGDMCKACNEEIVSCKSFVFSCSRSSITGIPGTDNKYVDEECIKFLLHKTCAESPRRIQSLRNREEFLDLRVNRRPKQTVEQFLCNLPAEFYTCNISSENEEYPELVHLPAATESSVNLLFEQFIEEMSRLMNEEGCSTRGCLKDLAHVEHPLQLVTVDELNDEKDVLLICDGCAKPIRDDGHVFYACVPCKYFLHKFCGELPTTNHQSPSHRILYHKHSPPYKLFGCYSCYYLGNGISFREDQPRNSLPYQQHIACSALPKMIKHESHPHPLHFNTYYTLARCKACGGFLIPRHGCEGCDFHLCAGCIMKPSRVKHRWDPHPLRLIFDPGMVEDHEHEFQCEYCSQDLDTNLWFYHCDDCDLSFHLRCYDKSCYLDLSKVKFGATNIVKNRLHHHSLTLVLNKKFRRCGECDEANIGEPVLECAPCKTIFCKPCSGMKFQL
ncbi:hypothetical protein ACET3Z_004461 [Daucus carota]